MNELIGVIAVIFGFLNISLVIIKGGKLSEFCAWVGWIVLGTMLVV